MKTETQEKYDRYINSSIIRMENLAGHAARFSPNPIEMMAAVEGAISCRETALKNAKQILDDILVKKL